MSIDAHQLSEFVIIPAISSLGMGGDNAVQLLLLTCAQETACGQFIVQKVINFSGGIGIYQMESPAYHSIWDNMIAPYPAIRAKFKLYLGYDTKPMIQRMATDLSLATMMARLYYKRVNEPIPSSNDIPGLAGYYKKYWNTMSGKATAQEAIANYNHYIKPL